MRLDPSIKLNYLDLIIELEIQIILCTIII